MNKEDAKTSHVPLDHGHFEKIHSYFERSLDFFIS